MHTLPSPGPWAKEQQPGQWGATGQKAFCYISYLRGIWQTVSQRLWLTPLR